MKRLPRCCSIMAMVTLVASSVFSKSSNRFCHAAKSMTGSSSSSSSSRRMTAIMAVENVVELWILRHGQATHNPRAEHAKANGCSFEEFLDLMRQDDSLDSPLTELGQEQARQVNQQHFSKMENESQSFQGVISSPLSRALQTADLAFPPINDKEQSLPPRICVEDFREINGSLLNAQRRTKTELQVLFPHWDFSNLHYDHDDTWKPEALESNESCRQRGYQGLCWILNHAAQQQSHVTSSRFLLVAHGGILRQTMQELPELVQVHDGRQNSNKADRTSCSRFDNCELRRYRFEWGSAATVAKNDDGKDDGATAKAAAGDQSSIILTELDLPSHNNTAPGSL